MPRDDLSPTTDEMRLMEGRIADVQQRRRGRIRWHITKHTAEMALQAIAPRKKRSSGKARRRKRVKRLL